MKKTLIALAVAGIAAAPIAAQADAVLYGTVSVDYNTSDDGTTDTGGIELDDTIIGIKGMTELDNGLKVTGEIKLDNTESFGAKTPGGTLPALAYLSVGGDFGTVWAGRFSNPLGAIEAPDWSVTGNATHIEDEIGGMNGIAYTSPNMGGVDFYVGGGSSNAGEQSNTASFRNGNPAASDNGFDAYVLGLNASFGAFSAHVGGGVNSDNDAAGTDTDQIGLKLKYSGDMLSGQLYTVNSESDDGVLDTTSTGVLGVYSMNNTSIGLLFQNDDTLGGDVTTTALQIVQNLGGGVKVYGEYAHNDKGDLTVATEDVDSFNLGMSYSF